MKIADKILIAAIASLILVVFVFIKLSEAEAGYLDISYDGELIYRCKLNYEGSFETEYGNIIDISKGKVSMIWADCPDELCVKQGVISQLGQSIICLPNKTVVQIIQ